MRTVRLSLALFGAALLMFTTGACGPSTPPTPAITVDQANQMTEDYLTQGLRALSPHAHINRAPHSGPPDHYFRKDHVFCYDLDLGREPSEPTDPVSATRGARVHGLDPTLPLDHHFTALRTWWANNNFTVIDDSQATGFLRAQNRADGFRMALQTNDLGWIRLDVSSACAVPTPEKNGTIPQN